MPTTDLNNEIERANHPAPSAVSVQETIETSALPLDKSRDIYSPVAYARSRIDTKLHRFWETLALLSGAFLMVHGMLSLFYVDMGGLWYFLSGIETCIGFVTILVDGWFLIHV